MKAELDPGWAAVLEPEFQQPYMRKLRSFLIEEKKNGGFFPPAEKILRAFELTPFNEVKVVILGQDPYHTPGCAEGLAFSVPDGVQHPPSLRNIFKEREDDLGLVYPQSGSLVPWAQRGVLLMNTVLTVRPHLARSHAGKGWERFTDAAVDALDRERDGLVFVLWGRDAREKGVAIDRRRHLVLESVHPSPLSARNGFFGSKPFSKANAYLQSNGLAPIDWSL